MRTADTLHLPASHACSCAARAVHIARRSVVHVVRSRRAAGAPAGPRDGIRQRAAATPNPASGDWTDDYNPSSEDLEELDRVAREMAEDFVRAGRRTEAREGEAADDESDWDVEGEADLGENDDTDEVVERDGFRLTVNTNWNVEERDAVDGADGPSTAGADGDVALLLEKRAAGKALSKRERALVRDWEYSRVSEVPARLLPKVAIVGRPNVGKSALFNRVAGQQIAIVYDYPGVTRDRMYTRATWNGREFLVVDTGGISSDADVVAAGSPAPSGGVSADRIPEAIERQAAAAIAEANVVVMVVDGQMGPTAADEEVAKYLRRYHGSKPVVLCVNKCENVSQQDVMAAPFWSLGFEPLPVSAISGSGSGDLLDRVVEALPPPRDAAEEEAQRAVRVAIVGRPNAGKSSLLNAVVGRERSIVSEMAGTTRDAIDTEFTAEDGTPFVLVDTAGIRRRTAVAATKDGAEPLSVQRAFAAIRRADVVVLVIDGTEGVTVQDFRVAERVAEEGRACVICVNKWDLVLKDSNTLHQYEKRVLEELRPINYAEVVFTSAKTKQRVTSILDACARAAKEHARRIPTATLNMVVQEAVTWKAPPNSRGSTRKARVYYATQAAVRPPTFVFFCNDARMLPDDYRRYLERQVREAVGFKGTPVRVFWRGKGRSESRGGGGGGGVGGGGGGGVRGGGV